MRPTLLIVIAGLCACGSNVIVEQEDSVADDIYADLVVGPSGGGEGDGSCVACTTGDCGWCDYEGGAEAFRCNGDRAPASSLSCVQTGSVYHDESGSYVCWRCDG